MISFFLVALSLSLLTVPLAGCREDSPPNSAQRLDTPSADLTNTVDRNFAPVPKEQAIRVAGKEVAKRGWNQFREIGCELSGDHWSVRLQRLPEVFGGHATVEVPTNGGAIRFVPGR